MLNGSTERKPGERDFTLEELTYYLKKLESSHLEEVLTVLHLYQSNIYFLIYFRIIRS